MKLCTVSMEKNLISLLPQELVNVHEKRKRTGSAPCYTFWSCGAVRVLEYVLKQKVLFQWMNHKSKLC